MVSRLISGLLLDQSPAFPILAVHYIFILVVTIKCLHCTRSNIFSNDGLEFSEGEVTPLGFFYIDIFYSSLN